MDGLSEQFESLPLYLNESWPVDRSPPTCLDKEEKVSLRDVFLAGNRLFEILSRSRLSSELSISTHISLVIIVKPITLFAKMLF